MWNEKLDGAHFEGVFGNIKRDGFIKYGASGVSVDAWFSFLDFFVALNERHLDIRIGWVARRVDNFQISRLYQDDREPFGWLKVRHRNHELSQVDFRILFGAQSKVIPNVVLVRQIQFAELDLRTADAEMARVRIKVVQ